MITKVTYEHPPGSGQGGMPVEYDSEVGHVLITTHGRLLAEQITQDMVSEGCAVQRLPLGQPKTLIVAVEAVE